LDEADRYARRIAVAAEADGALLIAHAYTRYPGDLAGCRVLASRLATAFDLAPSGLSFYAFPEIADVNEFAREYRADLDVAGGAVRDVDAVVEEAALAFQLNIDLSEAVQSIAVLSA
jgi:heme oxygenase